MLFNDSAIIVSASSSVMFRHPLPIIITILLAALCAVLQLTAASVSFADYFSQKRIYHVIIQFESMFHVPPLLSTNPLDNHHGNHIVLCTNRRMFLNNQYPLTPIGRGTLQVPHPSYCEYGLRWFLVELPVGSKEQRYTLLGQLCCIAQGSVFLCSSCFTIFP